MTETVLDRSRIEVKLGSYEVGSAMCVTDPMILPRVQDYRRRLSSRMVPLEKADIAKKMMPAPYHVSRKIDGEFGVLVYRDGTAFCMNPGGTVRVGLPWLAEAADILKQQNITEAMIAGEFFVHKPDGRARVHDINTIARQPKTTDDLERLHFAVFDVISWNGDAIEDEFAVTWERLTNLFGKGERIYPVESQPAESPEDISKLFDQWVEKEGGEGLVARSETAGLFKIKPRHTIDAVVIGFTESCDERVGLLHDLLLGVRREDGTFHILSRVGGGFNEDQRREFLSDLKDLVVESDYAEINSDHVAYQMVRPEWVIEISCLDLVSQTTRGGTINRMVLEWDAEADTYRIVRRMPLVSVISPQFIRRREDKTVAQQDIRIQQVAELVDVPDITRDAKLFVLPKSELLKREVYTKESKGDTMVRKFVMWQTNKESYEDYPAYVLHFTDFSPNRKNPLSRDVRVSDSQEQIEALWNQFVEDNIKRGWNLHVTTTETEAEKSEPVSVEAATEPVAVEAASEPVLEAASKPTKKKAKKTTVKKKAAKKKTKTTAKKKKKAATKMAESAKQPTKKKTRKKKSG